MKIFLLVASLLLPSLASAGQPGALLPTETGRVHWQGALGRAIDLSYQQRLLHFVQDENSPPIAMFSEEQAAKNTAGRYWGEHAGKWLMAASAAAARTGDAQLADRVRRVADYLVSTQRPNGYIGTYPEEWRFMNRQRELPRGKWDVWVTACVMKGLLETNRHFPDPRYVQAVRRMADLCWATFTTGGIEITDLSLFSGICATILLEPVADLYALTGEPRYRDLGRLILERADARPDFGLMKKSLAGADLQTIAEGKAYELCWQYVGLLRFHLATGDTQYRQMVDHAWKNIREHHLTLGGGPWGGIGVHREVFSRGDFFSPDGYVETCSVMAWMQLNRELLCLTGEAVYAEELEKSAYNSLLTAQYENGADWCYYTFPNGRRSITSEWMCCKSSGALALEGIGPVTYMRAGDHTIAVNLYGPNEGAIDLPGAGSIHLRQQTVYPASGEISIAVDPERTAEFTLALRIPSWAKGATIRVNGVPVTTAATPGDYARIQRRWLPGDMIALALPMHPILHRQSNISQQDTHRKQGDTRIMQTVMRYDYVAITRGPLVYATGLIDGFKYEETLRLPERPETLLQELPARDAVSAPGIRLGLDYRPPIDFYPYNELNERKENSWSLTWMQVTSPALPDQPH